MSTDKPKGSLFRLDMTNVTKSCIACGGTVVTTHTQIPVCAKCRAKGLVGADELKEATASLAKARLAATKYYDELKDLGTFDCPVCLAQITPNELHHDDDCELAFTLTLPTYGVSDG